MAGLWKVPDEETKALLGAFYTNRWRRKLSPLESLRQAQLTMLRNYGGSALSQLKLGCHGLCQCRSCARLAGKTLAEPVALDPGIKL